MNDPKDTVIRIDNPKYFPAKETQKTSINILCLDITHYSELTQFLLCTIFLLICYLSYGYYLELIFSKPEVRSVSLYITLIQFLITAALAYVESLIRATIKRKVPLFTYAILAALTVGTMSLSNLALSYLNYPTQLIFKSCKLIPVMIGSIIIMKKKYGFLDYAAAIIMCIGLTMFTLAWVCQNVWVKHELITNMQNVISKDDSDRPGHADSKVSPNFDVVGVFVILLALVCDAVIGNVQEKAMKQYQASNNEVVFYSYGIACVYLLFINTGTGVLTNGMAYCSQDTLKNYTNIFYLSVCGYMGLQAVLTLVRICGATVAVVVTTMRKVVSIIISFLLFSKPFTFQYVWSGMLVLLAIYLNHLSKKNPKYVPKPVLWCWKWLHDFHQHEVRYLELRTKHMFSQV